MATIKIYLNKDPGNTDCVIIPEDSIVVYYRNGSYMAHSKYDNTYYGIMTNTQFEQWLKDMNE